MTDKTTLTELAARCEAATGPDRKLDLEIGLTLPEPRPFSASINQQRGGKPPVPHFTASLDAAMTLVPEGWGVCIEQERPTRDCEASLSRPGCEPWGPSAVDAIGETLALALCGAALRARAAQEGE